MNRQEKIILEIIGNSSNNLTVKDIIYMIKKTYSDDKTLEITDLQNKTLVNRILTDLCFRGLVYKDKPESSQLPIYKLTNQRLQNNIAMLEDNNNNFPPLGTIIQEKPYKSKQLKTIEFLDSTNIELSNDFVNLDMVPIRFLLIHSLKADEATLIDSTRIPTFVKLNDEIVKKSIVLNMNPAIKDKYPFVIQKPINKNLSSLTEVITFLEESFYDSKIQNVVPDSMLPTIFKYRAFLSNTNNFIFFVDINFKRFFFDCNGFYSDKLYEPSCIFDPKDFFKIMNCNNNAAVLLKSLSQDHFSTLSESPDFPVFNLALFLSSNSTRVSLSEYSKDSISTCSSNILTLCSSGFLSILNGVLTKVNPELDASYKIYRTGFHKSSHNNFRVYLFLHCTSNIDLVFTDVLKYISEETPENVRITYKISTRTGTILISKITNVELKLGIVTKVNSFIKQYIERTKLTISQEIH